MKEDEWRHGTWRQDGRAIHLQLGDWPSNEDPVIGVMETSELAVEAVTSHNMRRIREPWPGERRLRIEWRPARPASEEVTVHG